MLSGYKKGLRMHCHIPCSVREILLLLGADAGTHSLCLFVRSTLSMTIYVYACVEDIMTCCGGICAFFFWDQFAKFIDYSVPDDYKNMGWIAMSEARYIYAGLCIMCQLWKADHTCGWRDQYGQNCI